MVSGDVTREEILESTTTEVDSTTDSEVMSPVKRVKTEKSGSKKGLTKACIEAAKGKAKEIFAISSDSESDGDEELQQQLAAQKEMEKLRRELKMS